MGIPLIILCAVPALFSKIFAKIDDLEQTKYASNKQLDAGAYGDYHHGVQQQTVKTIVDTQYNGDRTFDDNYNLNEAQKESDNKKHSKKHIKKTTIQLQEQQKKKK